MQQLHYLLLLNVGVRYDVLYFRVAFPALCQNTVAMIMLRLRNVLYLIVRGFGEEFSFPAMTPIFCGRQIISES